MELGAMQQQAEQKGTVFVSKLGNEFSSAGGALPYSVLRRLLVGSNRRIPLICYLVGLLWLAGYSQEVPTSNVTHLTKYPSQSRFDIERPQRGKAFMYHELPFSSTIGYMIGKDS